MALAAETRAAGVASSHRMMPTRTLIAVRVWLRAMDRISTRAFATLGFSLERSGVLVWRGRDRIDGGFRQRRAEGNRRKIRLCAVPFGTRDELNDFGAHDNSSDTAMITRPMSAIEIRQAVIGFSLEK